VFLELPFHELCGAEGNVEDSSLLILKRCSPEDRFFSALLQQICGEVGYKDFPPLCSALSFQYFQALMGMDSIMTPQTQASELLALPDHYHELAHFVLFRQRAEFEVPLLGLIHRFFADAIRKYDGVISFRADKRIQSRRGNFDWRRGAHP